ncbi:MAG: hypothetical protein OCD76_25390 [Reichenbachiella sp.]
MNKPNFLSNWFRTFAFLWLLMALLCFIFILVGEFFLDEPITTRIFVFSGFWITLMSLITATVLQLFKKVATNYSKKNEGRGIIEINNRNWVKQGIKIGLIMHVGFTTFTVITGAQLTTQLVLMTSPFFLLGFGQAYFMRNKADQPKE